jgi:hypothetical protein
MIRKSSSCYLDWVPTSYTTWIWVTTSNWRGVVGPSAHLIQSNRWLLWKSLPIICSRFGRNLILIDLIISPCSSTTTHWPLRLMHTLNLWRREGWCCINWECHLVDYTLMILSCEIFRTLSQFIQSLGHINTHLINTIQCFTIFFSILPTTFGRDLNPM